MFKTGIIYCPYHRPFISVQKRWRKIKECLDSYGIQYDMVQSEERQSVERLVMMMLNNGYDTIIIIGGDSALSEAANCFMNVEKQTRERVALGIIPNGTMNDFARFWGFYYEKIEDCVAAIAQRRIRKIDVGCIRYHNSKGERRQRYFLNCINVGQLADIQNMRAYIRKWLWSRRLTYAASLLLILFRKQYYKVKYKVNENIEKVKMTTLCVGNACGYGLTPNATPYSGLLDMIIVKHTFKSQLLSAVYFFIRKKILNYKNVIPYRTYKAELYTNSKLPINIDGSPMTPPSGGYTIEVIPEEINFIAEQYNVRKK